MEKVSKRLFIVHKEHQKLVDEIKSHLIGIKSNISETLVSKCFSQIAEINLTNEDLIQSETIVVIGASVEWLQQFNKRVRAIGASKHLKLIFGLIGQTSVHLFVDFGSNAKHLTFESYLKTIDYSISDQFNGSVDLLKPLVCGLICGQLCSTSEQSNQLFSYKIDSQITDYKFEKDRPIVVIGLGSLGLVIVTQLVRVGAKNFILIDGDSVHNYNLKHNFFNKSHIGLKKCDVVKDLAQSIDSEVKVEAFCVRAQQASHKFFDDMNKSNAVIISAIDNVETKRFLNKVCLNHCLPFIDVGVDGHMFHIQPIVPHLTESYFTYSDPSDPDYPLCVLKSFPHIIEHCVQWSKNKFENWFNKRAKRADNWNQCLHTSRLIFEKFFTRKAKQLLFSLPLDRKDENGVDFWADKQPPHPLVFDLSNDMHKNFLILCAQLIATVNKIEIIENYDLSQLLSTLDIPEFIPKSGKLIITDPSITQTSNEMISSEINGFNRVVYSRDNDNHLKFIHLLTNLRAEMYGIGSASISEVNRIHNKIIDCFGSTLMTASAMVSIELIKLMQLNGDYRLTIGDNVFKNVNYFYNLSNLDICLTPEPQRPNKTKLSNTFDFTEWDQWVLNESDSMSTLEDVLNELNTRSGSVCKMMVMDDSKSIYLPELFPHHLKRKKQTMRDIIANYYSTVPPFVTLSVSFELEDGEEITGPTIKYNFNEN